MDISTLLVALLIIAIVCVIFHAVASLVPMPPPVKTILWAVLAIICILILLGAVTGRHIVSW